MKKSRIILLGVATVGLVVLSMTACRKPDASHFLPTNTKAQISDIATDTHAEPTDSQTVPADTQTQAPEIPTDTGIRYEGLDHLPKSYQQVLNNKKAFCLQGYGNVYLDTYFSSVPEDGSWNVAIAQIATPDGKQMLAIQRLTDTLVLCESDGVVYGNNYSFRGMYNLYTNGVYYWNHTDSEGLHYGADRLIFRDGEFVEEELYHVDQRDDGGARYILAGKESTLAEIQAYVDAMEKSEVSWLGLKVFTGEM